MSTKRAGERIEKEEKNIVFLHSSHAMRCSLDADFPLFSVLRQMYLFIFSRKQTRSHSINYWSSSRQIRVQLPDRAVLIAAELLRVNEGGITRYWSLLLPVERWLRRDLIFLSFCFLTEHGWLMSSAERLLFSLSLCFFLDVWSTPGFSMTFLVLHFEFLLSSTENN